jgi:hypothetical protein
VRAGLVRLAVALLLVALGVGLGAGPLQHDATRRDKALKSARAEAAARGAKVASLQARAAYADSVAKGTAPAVLAGKLTGRSITLITLPGADPTVVASLRSLIAVAGGQITASVPVTATLEDPSSRQLVESLTSQMLTQAPDVTVATTATGYQRFGALLARAVGAPIASHLPKAAVDTTAISIASGLTTAGLLAKSSVPARGGLALVVTGPDADAAHSAVLASMVDAFAHEVLTVVAGPSTAAGPGGLLAALRKAADRACSTVDGADAVSGQVTAVLALAVRPRGVSGDFGSGAGASAALPPS